MPERGEPDMDDVREALREHDERVEQNEEAEKRAREREEPDRDDDSDPERD
jgi:hypothetical protein